jgi:hypothetical protein
MYDVTSPLYLCQNKSTRSKLLFILSLLKTHNRTKLNKMTLLKRGANFTPLDKIEDDVRSKRLKDNSHNYFKFKFNECTLNRYTQVISSSPWLLSMRNSTISKV